MNTKFTPVKAKHTSYFARATWQARSETPEALAGRFLRQIDALAAIDPMFRLWTTGVTRPIDLEKVRDRYAAQIEASISKDDWGEPVPVEGYWFGAITRGEVATSSYALRITAGACMKNQRQQNSVQLSTFYSQVPAPEAITFRIFRSSLLSLASIWEPLEVSARPAALIEHSTTNGLFEEPWMQYLAAPLATLVTPPPSAIVEHLPGGGLLMSATTETFSVDNPAHLAVAHDIARAIAPLNELPYVTDRGY